MFHLIVIHDGLPTVVLSVLVDPRALMPFLSSRTKTLSSTWMTAGTS